MVKSLAIFAENLEATIGVLPSQGAAPAQSATHEQKEIAAQIARLAQMQAQRDAAEDKMLRMQAEQATEKEKILQANINQLLAAQKEEANKKYKPMPIIISSVLGLAALFVVLSRRDDPID